MLSFSSEALVFPFPTYKPEDQTTQNYNLIRCFL